MMKIKTIQIGRFSIKQDAAPFVIAEAGVNHNGSLETARELVRRAKECGADCVKFQTFKAERVASLDAPKAAYQLESTDPQESQIDMLRKLELKEKDFAELFQTCREEGILFLSTPYNFEDVDLLDGLGVAAFKVASGQLVELPFLDYVAKKARPVILSTGMGTLGEVKRAVETIRGAGNDRIILLQCTTNYPSAVEDANLKAMVAMRDACRVLTGYSDHTCGSAAAVAAVALGACVVEKHFTLNKTLPGPDQSSSADPEEFARFVLEVRNAGRALGSGEKVPSETEKRNMKGMRRGLAAKTPVPAGTKLSWENVTFKRPASGFLGDQAGQVIGKIAKQDIEKDTFITKDMIA